METFKSCNSFYSVGNLAVFLSVLLLTVLFLPFYTPRHSIFSRPIPPMGESETKEIEKDYLAAALEKASKGNKATTVIIAVVNEAYVDGDDSPVNMLDLFLDSFWLGDETRPLIDRLLIVATHPTAYERCVFRGLHCYLLANETETHGADSTGEKVYMSKGFINMMWTRTLFLLTVLKRGYSFVFTDTDVMWLRNPFTRLNTNQTGDIQFSIDWFTGDARLDINRVNTGFYHVRSNNKTISLFERWYSMHNRSTRMKDQDVLQKLIRKGILRDLNLTATFLETRYFSGFCQDSKDFNKVVTVHANCCRYISAKVKDLALVLNDWKRFKRFPPNDTSSIMWSPHTSCQKSWEPKM